MKLHTTKGFTLLEILIVMIIIAMGVIGYITIQKSTWAGTRKSNQTMIAGHVIEKQIESLRLQISRDPEVNFPSLVDLKNNTIEVDSNGIKVYWTVRPSYDRAGTQIDNVREVELKAKWRAMHEDSVVITTCIAKNF